MSSSKTTVDKHPVNLSIVMPCLNEADTLAICIEKAQKSIKRLNISAEIIIADNGSTDGSLEIAKKGGARIVNVTSRGYGSALMGGIAKARGKYIIMGDADDSYDFLDIAKFVSKLNEGYDLVQGCRLPAGGGTVLPGAMPKLHRLWGNPMFTFLARRWFGAPIHDIYCGLRGFNKSFYISLNQQCTGMEFATEMIIKSSLYKAKIAEVPITLHPDGRKAHAPHLKTFRDGWRTLRFFLMYSPRQLFLIPGILFIITGLIGYLVGLANAEFGIYTLLFSSLAILCGYQAIWFAIFTKVFAINEGLIPEDSRLKRFFDYATLERGIMIGLIALTVSVIMLVIAAHQRYSSGFNSNDYNGLIKLVIIGVVLAFISFQTLVSSFFVSILGMKRKTVL